MSTQEKVTKRVAVRHLLQGAVLAGTGETVIWAYRGVHTPKGKMAVRLRKPDGTVRDAVWNASTTVHIADR